MLRYDQPLFRPPSEADALILQVTLGCSHNRCTFCSMYRGKRFRPRPLATLEAEIASARAALGATVVRRVFLADGDALCLSPRRLRTLLDRLNAAFPELQRVALYANARDVLRKSDDELLLLRERKLRLIYVGLESGDPVTLARVEKGATPADIEEAVRRAEALGIRASVMILVGLAGRARSLEHARASAATINRMAPTYTSLLTYTPTPRSPLGEEVARGDFELPTPHESLLEIREFLAGLDPGLRTVFGCNHASNYLPLAGRLPAARAGLLALVDAALAGDVPLRPEHLRGL